MITRLMIILLLVGFQVASGFSMPSNAEEVISKTTSAHIGSRMQGTTCILSMNNPAIASAVASKLYPASMIGTLGEIFFLTREEMECPRGAAVGFIAQIATVIISIPMISITKNVPGVKSFLEIDWLHFIESIMFWASIHVQCISFRQAVRSMENNKSLPDSAVDYRPMANMLLLVFGSIFAAAIGHYFVDTQSWQHTKLFGGFLNPPTPGRNEVLPGELSFLTWIFHWSMIIDYCYTLPRYMWRWGEADCTGNRKWKLYTLLHSPAFLVNAIVMVNHLHRDQLTFLKILHPMFVFIGSIATLFGSFAVSKANGWNSPNIDRKAASSILRTFRKDSNSIGKDWDISYTLASIAAGSVLAYGSLYLSV